MFIQKKRPVAAAEEVEVKDEVEVDVAPEATDILFEAEDVAELLAEVTDEVVEVSVDGEDIIFSVGEDEFTVTPDGDEELVESSTRVLKKAVAASKTASKTKKPVQASKRVVRKVSK